MADMSIPTTAKPEPVSELQKKTPMTPGLAPATPTALTPPANPVPSAAPIAVSPANPTNASDPALGANIAPTPSAPAPAAPLPVLPSGSVGNGVTATPTDPNASLTTQTLSVAPTVDRFKIAQDRYDAAVKAADPAYQASLRDAQRHAFGAGRGVSGMLRTSLGDEAARHQNALEAQRSGFLSDALEGTIGDAFKNVGIAQDQQKFQAGQQNTAYNQDYSTKQLQELLTNGAFDRALKQLDAGNQNDPSKIALVLSEILGQQATGAGQAASGLFNQQGQNSQTNLPKWLQDILNGTQATSPGQATNEVNSP